MKILLILFLATTATFAQLDSRVGELAKRFKPFGWVEVRDDVNVGPAEFFESFGQNFGLGDKDVMRLVHVDSSNPKRTRHRFQQYHDGLEVEGAVYVVHANDARVGRANGKIVSDVLMNIQPHYTAEEAYFLANQQLTERKHLAHIRRTKRDSEEPLDSEDTEADQKLLLTQRNDDLMLSKDNLVLAYKFFGYQDSDMLPYALYIDANTGKEIKRVPMFSACFSTTDCLNETCNSVTDECTTDKYGNRDINSLYDNAQSGYILYDDCRGVGIHTKEFVSSSSVDVVSSTTDFSGIYYTTQAHWAAMMTYDYFCNIHDNKLLDGSGYQIRQLVGFTTPAQYYEQGSGNATRVVLGVGVLDQQPYCSLNVSIDMVAHEWAHGITDYSSNLNHTTGEAAALNEGFSDIFGKMVQLYVDRLSNPSLLWSKFTVSDEICLTDSWVRRRLDDPDASGLADVYGGAKWNGQGTANGSAQKYLRAGVLLKWFYLLAIGGQGTNCHPDYPYRYDVEGIGPDKAAAIAYATLVGLTPTDGYAEARELSIASASSIYGSSSAEEFATIEAWNAVGVYSELDDEVCGDYYSGPLLIQAPRYLESCNPPPDPSTTFYNGATADLRAGKSIRLKSGFRAQAGSFVHAMINTCPREFGKSSIVRHDERGSTEGSILKPGILDARIVPNPVGDELKVFITPSMDCQGSIEIVDTRGTVSLTQNTVLLKKDRETQQTVMVNTLPNGVYYCVIRFDHGLKSFAFVRLP